MKYLFVLGIFLWSIRIDAQIKKIEYQDVFLKTIDNKRFAFSKTKKTYTVFVFFAPECPLSQNYTLVLNKLYKTYQSNVNFIGIFCGSGYKNSLLAQFKKKYSIPYILLKDEKLELTSRLNATVTPEVFLLDASGKLLYSGAIDDWAISLGKTRKQPTANYLENAITHAIHNISIKPAFVKPVGCYIENEN